jgi:hypothetical protein
MLSIQRSTCENRECDTRTSCPSVNKLQVGSRLVNLIVRGKSLAVCLFNTPSSTSNDTSCSIVVVCHCCCHLHHQYKPRRHLAFINTNHSTILVCHHRRHKPQRHHRFPPPQSLAPATVIHIVDTRRGTIIHIVGHHHFLHLSIHLSMQATALCIVLGVLTTCSIRCIWNVQRR